MEICGRSRRWRDILGPGDAESARSLPFRAPLTSRLDCPLRLKTANMGNPG